MQIDLAQLTLAYFWNVLCQPLCLLSPTCRHSLTHPSIRLSTMTEVAEATHAFEDLKVNLSNAEVGDPEPDLNKDIVYESAIVTEESDSDVSVASVRTAKSLHLHEDPTYGGYVRSRTPIPVPAEDEELMEELKTKDLSFYKNMKNLPDSLCKKYMPDLRRRWQATERRVKDIETMLWALPHEDRTLEEDRFEILGELLDKAAQGLDIWDEHHDRNIKYGHRVELETRLLRLINAKFDIICKIANEFDKLKGDKDGADHEREFLRYEIRDCDMKFVEIHESFLKSFLDMEW